MTTEAPQPTLDRASRPGRSLLPRLPAMDEMIEPDGSLRPHWRPFVSMHGRLGREEIISPLGAGPPAHPRKRDHPQRLRRPRRPGPPLEPRPAPAAPANAEWTAARRSPDPARPLLERAAGRSLWPRHFRRQRRAAPRTGLCQSRVSAPVHGISPPQRLWLHLYAADLVRSADGQFRVLSDRTQAPSGAGYSLENRIVLSRVLPDAFRQCNVLRLAPFFIALRKTLASLAPANRENPRVVLLTPGPYNETYFEHAYLARYLGYTLVQGNDLTVRDCRVYLKTLGGLQRVDVILRRVDDDFCDPLELYADSYLGVPGLVQAVREETVAVANALGTGVLQAPAFLPFLPALCRHLLGEDLRLPSVPNLVVRQRRFPQICPGQSLHLVIKAAVPLKYSNPVFGTGLSSEGLAELAAQNRVAPRRLRRPGKRLSFSTPVLVER